MYIAAGQGQNTPGDTILMSTETPCYFGHLLPLVTLVICYKFKKISDVWFYNIFFMILYMYIAPEQGWQPLGNEILMATGTSCHFGHLLQLSKKISFKSDFIQFFSWFYTGIWPRGRSRQPPGDKVLMSTKMSCHFIHLLQVSKQCLWSLTLNNFFMF